ncbi:MAG: PIN domain-containing protein [Kiritimatiellaeota bacterium]|nr:PIN domain-containing protein [Kiritimatiellota bacterium]
MNTVFLDTNIVLDVLLNREKFNSHSAAVWHAYETGKTHGLISAVSLSNIHYVYVKIYGKPMAVKAVRLTLAVFITIPLNEKILRLAADNPGNDFEDAIQLYSALEARASCIVTRNPRDFPQGLIQLFSPGEFLANHT